MTTNLLPPSGNKRFTENLLQFSTKHEAHDIPVFMLRFTGKFIKRILWRYARVNEPLSTLYEEISPQRRQL